MRTKHEQNIWDEIMINLNLEETKRILAQNGHYKLSDKLEVFRPCLNPVSYTHLTLPTTHGG